MHVEGTTQAGKAAVAVRSDGKLLATAGWDGECVFLLCLIVSSSFYNGQSGHETDIANRTGCACTRPRRCNLSRSCRTTARRSSRSPLPRSRRIVGARRVRARPSLAATPRTRKKARATAAAKRGGRGSRPADRRARSRYGASTHRKTTAKHSRRKRPRRPDMPKCRPLDLLLSISRARERARILSLVSLGENKVVECVCGFRTERTGRAELGRCGCT